MSNLAILQDNLLEYENLLAFLNSEQKDNGAYVDADALAVLRARFTRHIAYERKAGSSNFLEYWVPAYLSQVQLELYSSMLRANSSILQSQTATDSAGALRDIVMCLWKVCFQKIYSFSIYVCMYIFCEVTDTAASWLYVTVLQSPLPRWRTTFTCQHL